jgi:hypothetical protein
MIVNVPQPWLMCLDVFASIFGNVTPIRKPQNIEILLTCQRAFSKNVDGKSLC